MENNVSLEDLKQELIARTMDFVTTYQHSSNKDQSDKLFSIQLIHRTIELSEAECKPMYDFNKFFINPCEEPQKLTQKAQSRNESVFVIINEAGTIYGCAKNITDANRFIQGDNSLFAKELELIQY